MPRSRSRLAGLTAILLAAPFITAPPAAAGASPAAPLPAAAPPPAAAAPPTAAAAPPTAAAEEAPAYTITADPAATGPAINDKMYGVFFEDINYAADGGLYAELIRNRSFEFRPVDNASYTGLTAWTPTAPPSATTVDDAARLNERNRTYLRLALTGPEAGVTNAGFNTGLPVRGGELYDFSVWARTTAPAGTPLRVTLHTSTGTALAAPLTVTARGDRWTKYRGTIRATATSDAARLTVTGSGTATLRLDEVSLFPRRTFRNRPNGLRPDLADKIAALKPGFVRFPGGCIVNTGSHQGYDAASGFQRARSYQWKDTVGPVETRATNANFWGYNQSYGLGYYEYFQFAEDIGAAPLPVVPALVNGCNQDRATDDPALLQRHIQDTLDLIDFANGPTTSTWGRLRAQMGHPQPFGLKMIAVGNEETVPDAYFANFLKFQAAIRAKDPSITVIGNVGPRDSGPLFDTLWSRNRAAGTAIVDEHYYKSPAWFLQNNKRYDGYARGGTNVFLGEYASQDNKFANALSEAAYLTGLERNADVVRMASYAPLLANVDNTQWRPDMIWFDNDESWASASYEVQKLFMTNTGTRIVPSRVTGDVATARPITGRVGLSTWATAARFDDFTVTAPDGRTLLTEGYESWNPLAGRGRWSVVNGAFEQSDTAAQDTLIAAATGITETDYDITVKATKTAGAEGFLIPFGIKDSANFYWWNLGGWNNTQGAIERATAGTKDLLLAQPDRVETGRTYDLRIQVRGTKITLIRDGQVWGSFDDNAVTEPFAHTIARDARSGDLIVKVVNAQDRPARTTINLNTPQVSPTATMTVLTGAPTAENTRTATPIAPTTSTVTGIAPTFTRDYPPQSVTVLRIKTN